MFGLSREELCKRSTEIEVVVVVEHDAHARGARPGHEVVGREELDAVEREGVDVPARDAVSAPARASRDRDVIEVVREDLLGGQLAPDRDLDVAESLELGLAVVDHADPGGEPGEAGLAQHPAAELVRRLRKDDLVPAAPR